MRFFTIALLKFVIIFNSFSQSDKTEFILNLKEKHISKYDLGQQENRIFLKTDFASPYIVNSTEYKKIRDNVILKVELVYTTFKSNPTFDQKALNRKRIQSLKKLDPKLFDSEVTEWELVGQTDCNDPGQGKDFYHGFVITYRPASTEETVKKEIEFIEKALSGEDKYTGSSEKYEVVSDYTIADEMPSYVGGDAAMLNYISKSLKYPEIAKEKGIQGTVFIYFIINETGEISSARTIRGVGGGCDEEALRVVMSMPKWIPGKINGKPASVSYMIPIRFSIDGSSKVSDAVYYTGEIITTEPYVIYSISSGYLSNRYTSDSTIFKVFARNPKWNKMLVICDFTGSMSPYTSQLLIWHKLNIATNNKRIEYFTFFNDGDQKADNQKQIGMTGGIYHSRANSFDEVKDLAFKTMKGGFGGDTPENNIEALLDAIEKCEDCRDIVMIVDNFATPRDLSLLEKVNKPVKIIACGTFGGVNTAYLDIVRQTGGSLHTMERDILNLMDINEGEEIEIEGNTYIISQGKFVRKYKKKI